jgi:hypothetical protein
VQSAQVPPFKPFQTFFNGTHPSTSSGRAKFEAAHGDSSTDSELKAVGKPAVRLLERSNH